MSTFGMGFGNPTASAPTFGTGTGFGFGSTPAATTQQSTGFSFGLPAASTQTSGFSFGLPAATTQASGFSFGATATSAPSAFSFGGIGTTSTAPTFSFGNLGASTSTTPSGFSFGQPTAFGAGTGTTAFGTGAGGFGTNTGGFGTNIGGFGTNTGAFGTNTGIAATAVGTGTSVIDSNIANLAAATGCPILYGDERDVIIAKWNQIQALWGTGKGYFSSNAPPVEFAPENPYTRLKAVGYSCMPTAKPEDGLVSLIFNKKEEEIRLQQQQVIDSMHSCFGSKPNISVCIDAVKKFPDNKSEVVIYLIERTAAGTTQRISPTEVCAYLEQQTVKPHLASLGIANVYPKMGLSKEQLQHYLDNPPPGIDICMWQQAKVDNPCPEKLVPVPLIGFADLHRRMKCQEYETKQHQQRLDIIVDDIAELNRRHTTTAAKIAENKRKLIELQHRILKILVQQEILRKMGFSIQADEEQLRIKFEAIQAELSAPTQFKGHLRELISQIRMQNYQVSGGEGERYTMDTVAKEKLKEHLHLQHEGISHLISIIKEDMMDLKTIDELSKAVAERKL